MFKIFQILFFANTNKHNNEKTPEKLLIKYFSKFYWCLIWIFHNKNILLSNILLATFSCYSCNHISTLKIPLLLRERNSHTYALCYDQESLTHNHRNNIM